MGMTQATTIAGSTEATKAATPKPKPKSSPRRADGYNRRTHEYTVVMRLRETPPEILVDVAALTHLLAVRMAMQIHPSYVPVRVERSFDGAGPEHTHEVIGVCCNQNCGSIIVAGDPWRERIELVTKVDRDTGETTRQRVKVGIECGECR